MSVRNECHLPRSWKHLLVVWKALMRREPITLHNTAFCLTVSHTFRNPISSEMHVPLHSPKAGCTQRRSASQEPGLCSSSSSPSPQDSPLTMQNENSLGAKSLGILMITNRRTWPRLGERIIMHPLVGNKSAFKHCSPSFLCGTWKKRPFILSRLVTIWRQPYQRRPPPAFGTAVSTTAPRTTTML